MSYLMVLGKNGQILLKQVQQKVKLRNLIENSMIVMNIKESYPELIGDWLRVSVNTKDNNDLLVKKIKTIV